MKKIVRIKDEREKEKKIKEVFYSPFRTFVLYVSHAVVFESRSKIRKKKKERKIRF